MSSLAAQEAPSSYGIDTGHDTWNQSTSDYSGHNSIVDITEGRDTEGLLDELRQLAAATYRTRSRSSWLQYQVDWVQVEAAIAAEERNPDISLRHPKNEEQMERTTRMVETLVERLLSRSRNHQRAERIPTNPTDEFKEDRLLEEVEELGKSFPSYESPHVDPTAATEGRTLLNESFRRIFNKTTSDKEIVGKICYNLLLSSAAPNIHNYNALIAGFNRIRRPDLAQAVVDSYLDDVKWPATQQTIVCLLDHARGTNNLENFREIVGRMRGTAEDGLHFRIFHRGAIFNELGAEWVRQYATSRKHSYVERAPRGNEVFDSMVRGWLHFGKVDAASMSFVACLRKGHFVRVDTILALLTECLAKLDQRTARAMLKGLAKHFENFETLVEYIIAQSSTRVARRISDMFYALFDLCAMPYKPVTGTVVKSFKEVVEAFRNLHTVTHNRLQMQGFAESTCDVLEGVSSGVPVGVEKAFSLLSSAETNSLRDFQPNKRFRGIATLAALTKRVQTLEEKTKRIDAHAKVSIIKYQTGYDIDRQFCLPPIEHRHGWSNDKYPALFYALQSIRIGPNPVTLSDLKVQLCLSIPDRHVADKMAEEFIQSGRWGSLKMQQLVNMYDQASSRSTRRLSLGPDDPNQTAVGQLEDQILAAEDVTKNVLFCSLGKRRQERLKRLYNNWQDIPLAEIFRYHHKALDHRITEVRRYGAIAPHSIRKVEQLKAPMMGVASSSLERSWETEAAPPPPHRYMKVALASVPKQRPLWSDVRSPFTSMQQEESALY